MRAFTRRYGSHPLHLLVLIGCFCLSGYAATQLITTRPIAVAVWFVGAAVAHDFVLLPLYALVDNGVRRIRRPDKLPRVPWINYVRFPAAVSALLFLVFLPSIAQLSYSFEKTSRLSSAGYLSRWLAITGVLFLISAVAYAFRLRRAAHRPASR